MKKSIDFLALLPFFCCSALFVSCDDESFFMRTGGIASLGFSVSTADDGSSSTDGATRAVIHVMDAFELDGDTVYLAYTVTDMDAPADSAAADTTAAVTRATPITGTNLATVYGRFSVSAYLNGNLSTPLTETDDEGNAPTTGTAKEYVGIDYVYDGTYGSGASTEYLWKTTATPSNDDLDFYWPMDKTVPLTFYAYAPTTTVTSGPSWSGLTPSTNFKAGGKIQFDYTVPVSSSTPKKDAEAQPDILVGSIPSIKRTDSGITNVKDDSRDFCIVPLTFYHALSAVNFMVDDQLERNTSLTIQSLTLAGLKASGQCTYTPSTTGSKSADFISWDFTNVTTNAGSYTQTYGQAVSSSLTADIALGTPAQTFMLIPQTFGPGGNATAASLTIAYNEGSSKVFNLHRALKGDGTNVAWLPGKKYTYLLTGDLKDLSLKLGGALISWDKADGTYLPRHYVLTASGLGGSEPILTYDDPLALQHRGFTVTSYYYEGSSDTDDSKRTPVTFTMEYQDGSGVWHDFTPANYAIPTSEPYLSSFENNLGSTELKKASSYMNPSTAATVLASLRTGVNIDLSTNRSKNDLQSSANTDVHLWKDQTSLATGWDLSRMGVGCELSSGAYDGSAPRNSANCYVVRRPGMYKFPVVYGNGLKNGAASLDGCYSSTGTVSDYMMTEFINALGKSIPRDASDAVNSNQVWVLKDMEGEKVGGVAVTDRAKAALLWCDAKETVNSTTQLLIDPASVTLVKADGNDYISFETADHTHLVQGNAVIVLYFDADDDGTFDPDTDGDFALWSWHIWVTDAHFASSNLATIDATTAPAASYNGETIPYAGTYRFMTHDLGECDKPSLLHQMKQEWRKDFLIRIKQVEGDADYQYLVIRMPDREQTQAPNALYYQWGRKDPFTGKSAAVMGSTEIKPYYDADGTQRTALRTHADASTKYSTQKGTDSRTSIAEKMKRPGHFFTATTSDYGFSFTNLWSRDADNYHKNLTTQQLINMAKTDVVKTIYDPCPYGYKVPGMKQFLSLVADETTISGTGILSITGIKLQASSFWDGAILYPELDSREGNLILARLGYRALDGTIDANSFANNSSYRYTASGGAYTVFNCILMPKGNKIEMSPIMGHDFGYPIRPILEE